MHAHTSLVGTEGRDLSDRHVLPAYEWPIRLELFII